MPDEHPDRHDPDEELDRPEGPPDEKWSERELLRNQMLMDKYEEALGNPPDFSKYRNPEDLYNKVHYGIEPPERPDEEKERDDSSPTDTDAAGEANAFERYVGSNIILSASEADDFDPDIDPDYDDAGYREI